MYLLECISQDVPFCFSVHEIPNQEFLNRFKQKYQSELFSFQTAKHDDLNISDTGSNEEKENTEISNFLKI